MENKLRAQGKHRETASGCICKYRRYADQLGDARCCWQIAQEQQDLMFRYNVCLDCIVYVSCPVVAA